MPSITAVKGLPILLVTLFAGVLLVACGGGSDPTEGDGERITDPALVPSSTPMQNPMTYKISGDRIQILGGTTIANTGGTATAGRNQYEVQSGDTCSAIAANLGVTLDALMKANRTIDSNCSNLAAGQKLVIPGAATATATTGSTGNRTPTPSANGKEYTIAEGDTCSGIAANLGISIEQLRSANPSIDADCSNLQPGQKLKAP